jgi:hypothetical protein
MAFRILTRRPRSIELSSSASVRSRPEGICPFIGRRRTGSARPAGAPAQPMPRAFVARAS